MNYLTELMNAREIDHITLAKMSGVSLSNLRRLTAEESAGYSYKKTQKRLAQALGVTVSELVKGGKRMKNKILEAEVRKAIEHLTAALHKYTDEPMYLSLAIFTKDKTVRTETDPEGIPDYYTVRSYVADTEQEHTADDFFIPKETVIDESARVYYGEDGIRQVIPFER